MAKKHLPSQDRLRQLFRYDPESGKLFYAEINVPPYDGHHGKAHHALIRNRKFAGKEVLGARGYRYMGMRVDGSSYYLHRIIWKLHTGEEPDTIDHINGDCFDNRIVNLRNVTTTQNMRNLKLFKNNTTGHSGLKRTAGGKWQARFCQKHLGTFATKEAAIEARKAYEATVGYVSRR